MKKVLLIIALLFCANSVYSQVYHRDATHGTHGGIIDIHKTKKGFKLFAQDYRYDYHYVPTFFEFKKKKDIVQFVKNLDTVLNVWNLEELSKEDFPEGISWEGIGYKLVKLRTSPDELQVRLNTDFKLDYDTFLTFTKEDVAELTALFSE